MWEETGVPGGNPRVRVGDHHALSRTTTVDHKERARVALVRSEGVNRNAARTPFCAEMASRCGERYLKYTKKAAKDTPMYQMQNVKYGVVRVG